MHTVNVTEHLVNVYYDVLITPKLITQNNCKEF